MSEEDVSSSSRPHSKPEVVDGPAEKSGSHSPLADDISPARHDETLQQPIEGPTAASSSSTRRDPINDAPTATSRPPRHGTKERLLREENRQLRKLAKQMQAERDFYFSKYNGYEKERDFLLREVDRVRGDILGKYDSIVRGMQQQEDPQVQQPATAHDPHIDEEMPSAVLDPSPFLFDSAEASARLASSSRGSSEVEPSRGVSRGSAEGDEQGGEAFSTGDLRDEDGATVDHGNAVAPGPGPVVVRDSASALDPAAASRGGEAAASTYKMSVAAQAQDQSFVPPQLESSASDQDSKFSVENVPECKTDSPGSAGAVSRGSKNGAHDETVQAETTATQQPSTVEQRGGDSENGRTEFIEVAAKFRNGLRFKVPTAETVQRWKAEGLSPSAAGSAAGVGPLVSTSVKSTAPRFSPPRLKQYTNKAQTALASGAMMPYAYQQSPKSRRALFAQKVEMGVLEESFIDDRRRVMKLLGSDNANADVHDPSVLNQGELLCEKNDVTRLRGLISRRQIELRETHTLENPYGKSRNHPGGTYEDLWLTNGGADAAWPLQEHAIWFGRQNAQVCLVNSQLPKSPLRHAYTLPKIHGDLISRCVEHPKLPLVATASDDHTWKLVSVESGKVVLTGEGHASWVTGFGFHHDGNVVVTTGVEHSVKLWDLQLARCVHTIVPDTARNLWSVATHDFSDFFAVGCDDGVVRVYCTTSGKQRQTMRGHVAAVTCVDFQNFSNTMATASNDKTVSMWDLRSGICVKTFRGHESLINSVASSADNKFLVSADESGMSRLWDVRFSGEYLRIDTGGAAAHSARFDCSGKAVAIGTGEGTTLLFDVETQVFLQSLESSGEGGTPITDLLWTRENERLVTVGADGGMVTWKVY